MTRIFARSSLLLATSMSFGLAGAAIAQDTAETPTEETAPAVEVTADTVVATVNGADITVGDLIVAKLSLPQQYQQLPDDVLFPGLIDQVIQQTVLSDAADTLSALAEAQLEAERRALLASEYLGGVMEEAVTDEAVQAAYDATYGDAEPTPEWNASHILVETEEEAQSLIEQLDGGADFAELAMEFSTGPSGPNGGELGWFGPGMMVAPFEEAVVDMEAGDVAGPIQTQFGWHVVKLNDTRVQDAPALEDVRAELEAQVQTTAAEEALQILMDDADISREDITGMNPAAVSDLTLLD